MSRPLQRSFHEEAPTYDDDSPTVLNGLRSDRTIVELGDPEPTIPPEPADAARPRSPIVPAVTVVPPPSATAARLPLPAADDRFAGRYQLEQQLGQGAFGRVFAARDTKLGRPVAVKLLHGEYLQNAEIRQRFLQEAHAAACIAHPGIVTMFDVGDAESPYLTMELLDGESLQARIKRDGPMPSAKAREVARQAAAALSAAHRSGVIHRDLKPENIFLVPDPAAIDGERVKVLDFGLAKPTLTASVKTRVATVFGTPLYMGPEQFERTANTDPRSDIYALGCVLYHLVTGRPPYEGTLREVVTQHQWSPPPSLRAVVPDACEELDAIVRRMLAKNPADRYQSMDEVERALRPRAPTAPAAPAGSRGSRTLGAVVALVGLVIALGVGLTACGPASGSSAPAAALVE